MSALAQMVEDMQPSSTEVILVMTGESALKRRAEAIRQKLGELGARWGCFFVVSDDEDAAMEFPGRVLYVEPGSQTFPVWPAK